MSNLCSCEVWVLMTIHTGLGFLNDCLTKLYSLCCPTRLSAHLLSMNCQDSRVFSVFITFQRPGLSAFAVYLLSSLISKPFFPGSTVPPLCPGVFLCSYPPGLLCSVLRPPYQTFLCISFGILPLSAEGLPQMGILVIFLPSWESPSISFL